MTHRERSEEDQPRVDADRQQAQRPPLEAVGRLAGGVAHNFNNLLTVMLGQCYLLLQETPEGDDRREGLLEIRKAGESAAALTKQLLEISADPGLIEQTLLNFVVKARDAMPDGGQPTIETSDVIFDKAFADTRPGRTVQDLLADRRGRAALRRRDATA